MLNQRRIVFFVLTLILFSTVVSPVFAMNYVPGVTAGQYVKFGNYSGTDVLVFPGVDLPLYKWIVREVVAVSGKEVTMHISSLVNYKNGTTDTINETMLLNIESGTNDGFTPIEPGIIIPAYLNEGDAIPPFSLGIIINETETRTYLGVSRSVNIINYSISTPEGTFANYIVYDKASGVMLENLVDSGFFVSLFGGSDFITSDPHAQLSSNIIETNIFGGASNEAVPSEYVYIAVAAIIIVITVAVAMLLLRKRSNQNRKEYAQPQIPTLA
jgi:hypothetical protein